MYIDIDRVFKDIEYKELMKEYHEFVLFILNDINRYTIHSCSVGFDNNSILYRKTDEFMKMLKATFPTFNVTFETSNECSDLNDGEYCISVDWENHKKIK